MARTLDNYSRKGHETCELLIVRYKLGGDRWQAVRVLPITADQAEMTAYRLRDELRAEGRDAEVARRVPVL